MALCSQVISKDPSISAGAFEDVEKVKKFELSDEAYTKREGRSKCIYSFLLPGCLLAL